MTSITKEEEEQLDNNESIHIKRGGFEFNIEPNDVFCYGHIDFHDNSADMDVISGFKWLNHLVFRGVIVPANYDYEKHCAYSDIKTYRYYDTMKPEVVAQYAHGCIGKPERTIIFKQVNKAHGKHRNSK